MKNFLHQVNPLKRSFLSLTTVQGINSRVTRVGTFEVSVSMHVALRMFIMQVLASQLHFLANKNAELAIPPLFWPVNCIKIGGHVALLSDPTVYSLYCERDSHLSLTRG